MGAVPTIIARETIDDDGNGQIDYIKITTNENLDDDFSGLTMTVAGYTLDVVTPYVTNIGGGGANDDVFYVKLQESGSPDTGVTPTVGITANTTLGDSVGNDLAVDWWDTNWLNRKKITFDNTNSAENLTDFPVLVALTAADIDFAKMATTVGVEGEVVQEPSSFQEALERAKRATAEGRPYLLDVHVGRFGIGDTSSWHPPYSIAALRQRKV